MKVVLFCGGLGMRLRDYAENVPKPMVPLGYRPILWHLMKYYAHFGHRDFVLCLGLSRRLDQELLPQLRGGLVERLRSQRGRPRRQLLTSDIEDWRITFVETGLASNIGQRLRAVRPHLEGEEMFLANYADGLSDVNLHDQVAAFSAIRRVRVLSFRQTKSELSFRGSGRSGTGAWFP